MEIHPALIALLMEDGFQWDDTPQGHNFWEGVSAQLRRAGNENAFDNHISTIRDLAITILKERGWTIREDISHASGGYTAPKLRAGYLPKAADYAGTDFSDITAGVLGNKGGKKP